MAASDSAVKEAGVPLAPPPRAPEGLSPRRAPNAVRRTSSIEIDWPDGRERPMRVAARARDLATGPAGQPTVLADAAYEARLDAERRILAIAGAGPAPDLSALVGERAGARLRAAIARELPDERRRGTPLYLILDDLAGASLVAPWAWSQWDADWAGRMIALKTDPRFAAQMAGRENICSGLRTGSSGLGFAASGAPAIEPRDPADPDGWHAFAAPEGTAFRRARRIDVAGGDVIAIDAHFQDSATRPDGGRAAVHEYVVRATARRGTLELLTLVAEPRVLPFAECVPAAANVARLIGTPLPALRETVLETLRGTAGCTHLNDAVRALAEGAAMLGGAGGASGRPAPADA